MAEAQEQIRILVVDDDDNVRFLVSAYLEREGYLVASAADGAEALRQFAAFQPEVLILDLMLPGVGGLEVAKKVRASREIPILMLTARGEEEDVLAGFDAGADDYLTKPFSPKVLVARVEAILRRVGVTPEEGDGPIVRDGLVLDGRSREVTIDGRPVELTTLEFELLQVLAEHPGWVYSREQLLERVWGFEYLGDSRVVDVHVANLRKKIGDDSSSPRFIATIRGVGYKFRKGDSETSG
ncbi:MAG TPA: response regulator transcription factor [Thermoleophilia bacterium]|nr:response regulator transcription factor [Thermoleophilia bacterium]